MKPLLLASASPRRAELLRAAGIPFFKKVSDIEENVRNNEKPLAFTRRIAWEKAHAVAQSFTGSALLLSADTIVVHPDGKKILGKPRDRQEALSMIRQIQGRKHQVITSFVLLEIRRGKLLRRYLASVKTDVMMRALSARQIRAYVDCAESMDKAGAYAAQGVGMTLIASIRGSYTNVVGLPMAEVLSAIQLFTRKK